MRTFYNLKLALLLDVGASFGWLFPLFTSFGQFTCWLINFLFGFLNCEGMGLFCHLYSPTNINLPLKLKQHESSETLVLLKLLKKLFIVNAVAELQKEELLNLKWHFAWLTTNTWHWTISAGFFLSLAKFFFINLLVLKKRLKTCFKLHLHVLNRWIIEGCFESWPSQQVYLVWFQVKNQVSALKFCVSFDLLSFQV